MVQMRRGSLHETGKPTVLDTARMQDLSRAAAKLEWANRHIAELERQIRLLALAVSGCVPATPLDPCCLNSMRRIVSRFASG
jgi:hypothetical protein